MSISTDTESTVSFGTGGIIADSFSIFFGNIVKVVMLGFLPALGGLVVTSLASGWGVALGTETDNFAEVSVAPFILSTIVSMGLWGLGVALLVQLAYDAKHGRSRPISQYFGPALRSAIPIAILSMIGAFVIGIGFLLLVVPGLWLYGALAVVVPAVVFDKVGFGGLGRSFNLTKGYRWPIVGVVIVILICTMLIDFAATFVAGIILKALGSGEVIIVASTLLVSLVYALIYGLSGISTALIYARLREIKEGTQISELAAVFD